MAIAELGDYGMTTAEATRNSLEVTGVVLFTVSVATLPVDDSWVCIGKETGVIAVADSQDEAVSRNAKMHQALVRRLKRNGPVAMVRFMQDRDICFRVQEDKDGQIRTFRLVTQAGSNSTIEAAA